MTKALAQRSPNIDPDFAAAYAEAESPGMPGQRKPDSQSEAFNPEVVSKGESEEDGLQAAGRILFANEQEALKRKEKTGFDQIEHDVSNALKVGWDILTRP